MLIINYYLFIYIYFIICELTLIGPSVIIYIFQDRNLLYNFLYFRLKLVTTFKKRLYYCIFCNHDKYSDKLEFMYTIYLQMTKWEKRVTRRISEIIRRYAVRYYSNYRGGSRTKEAKTQRCYGKLYTDFYKSHNCTEMYTDFHI